MLPRNDNHKIWHNLGGINQTTIREMTSEGLWWTSSTIISVRFNLLE